MARAQVVKLFVHPVKGLTPQALEAVEILAEQGVAGDRAFALLFEDAFAERQTRDVPWLTKTCFVVQHDWPGLAALRCVYDPTAKILEIRERDALVMRANVTHPEDLVIVDEYFTTYVSRLRPEANARHPAYGKIRLVGTPDGKTRYPDRGAHHVSILNKASLDAVAKDLGVEALDVRRFRGNVVLDGFDAWDERGWIGRELRLDRAVVKVTAEIARCANVDVDPDTGRKNLALLDAVARSRGRGVFGVVARVVTPGRVAVGDQADL